MRTFSILALLCHACITLSASQAWAGEGHDHGEASVASGPALPRFSAVSETFELVGVVNGKQLTLYLDRYADNTPVKGAQVELELGGRKVALESHAVGEFEATLAEELKPGVIPVAATIIAGEETDLLAGELDMHEAASAPAAPQAHGSTKYALWIGVVGLAAAMALVRLMRRARTARSQHAGGTA